MSGKSLILKMCVGGVLATAAALAGAAEDKSSALEEIVVTAQKRSESLQDVPVAVSAFTSTTRDLVGIQTVQDFTNFTPGITYSTSLDRMFVRGIGRYTNNLATSPGVASYGDGFYNSSNHQADSTPLFTERVEILRGPQGTLYGRNSIGGALNVLLKRPTDEFGGEVRVVGGNFDRRAVEGLVSGPITDWMKFLVGGNWTKQTKGFTENIAGQDEFGVADNKYGLAQLSIKIGDIMDIWIKYTHTEWDEGYGTSVNIFPYVTFVNSATLVTTGSLGPSALYNQCIPTAANPNSCRLGGVAAGAAMRPAAEQYLTPNPGVLNHHQTNHNIPGHDTLLPDNQTVLEVVTHLPFADLKYVGGYHDYVYTLRTDFDNSTRTGYTYTPPNGLNPVFIYSDVRSLYIENKRYYSNELNLTSTGDGKLQWIGGLYQYHEFYDQPVAVGTPAQTQLRTPLFSPGFTPAPANPDSTYSYTDARMTNTSMAAFGQLDFRFIDQLKGTLGLRYTVDKKYGDEFTRLIFWDPTTGGSTAFAFDITGSQVGTLNTTTRTTPASIGVPTNDGTGRYTRHLNGEWHATTGTAGLEWNPVQGSLGYLKYTRGYKDGAISPGSITPNPYADPEFVDAYEIGWKQDIGGHFQLNSSVFYYDTKDAQIPLTIIQGPGLPNISQTFNIDAKSFGVELESIWSPIDALQFRLNYSYLDAKLHNDTQCFSDALDSVSVGPQLCATGGHLIDGNVVPGSPKNKVAFNVLYTLHFSPGSLALSGSYTWRDEVYSSIFTRPEWLAPAYSQTDFRATWTGASNNYSVVGYLRNAFDQEGFDGIAATATAGGITRSFSLTPPRQYGLELQYRFGSAAR